MISRKYETIVGLFVLGSLAALLVMVLIIAQQEGLWQEYVEYRAVFKNVSGLKKGSESRLAGVMVGTVMDITISKDGRITVIFQVLGKYQSQIRHDSMAGIGYIGLLGDRSLDISAGSPDQPVVPPNGQVAAVEPLDIQDMLSKATPYVENLQKILSNLASLTESLMGRPAEGMDDPHPCEQNAGIRRDPEPGGHEQPADKGVEVRIIRGGCHAQAFEHESRQRHEQEIRREEGVCLVMGSLDRAKQRGLLNPAS